MRPMPDNNTVAQSTDEARILAALKSSRAGWGVDEFMQQAAAAYYAGAKPFGREGDFITSPEISQMFGEMIGLWCADLWQQAGCPDAVTLAELGPGRGTLMADILRTARNWPAFHKALRIHLVETSPQLRKAQTAALADMNPVWHDRVDTLPRDAFSLIVSNEFFDALPVRQFVWQGGLWHERGILWDDARQKPVFTLLRAADEAAVQSIPAGITPKEGDIFEASPACRKIAAHLAAHIAQSGGACLAIDYGHAQSACGDTLQAVSKHKYADVLQNIGRQDITAHVDFGALGAAAARAGAHVFPVVTQGDFLNALGIAARAQQLAAKAKGAQKGQIPIDLHRLTAPSAMGVLFKVICWIRAGDALAPAGFQREG